MVEFEIFLHFQKSKNQGRVDKLLKRASKWPPATVFLFFSFFVFPFQYSSVDNNGGGDDIDNGNAARSSSSSSSSGASYHSASSIDNAVNNSNIPMNNTINNDNNRGVFAPSESCFIIDEGSVTFNK